MLDSYRWLAGVLRGERSAAAGEAVPTDRYADNPLALFHAHVTRALAAAIFGDPAGLARHTAAAMPLLPAVAGLYPTAVAHLLRGLALAGQARAGRRRRARRAAGRTGRGDAAGWPPAPRTRRTTSCTCCGCSRPSGPGRSATSAPPSLAFDAARREVAGGSARGTGPDHRTRGPLLPRPRPRPRRLRACSPRPARSTSPGARPRRSTSSTGPTRPCGPTPTRPTGTGDRPPIVRTPRHRHDRDDRPARHPVRVPGAELRDQHRPAARPRGRGAQRDDRRHRRPPAAVERRPARLAAARTRPAAPPRSAAPATSTPLPMSVLRYVQRTGEPLVVADATRDDRFARDPYFTDLDLLLAAGRARSSAAARCGRCCCWRTGSSAARSPPNGSTRSSSSPASSPSPSTTPSSTPSSPRRARGSSPPPTRPAGASSATCTTAPSSGWSPSP